MHTFITKLTSFFGLYCHGDGLTFIGAGTAIAGIAVEIPDFGVVLRALSAAIPVSVSL